MNLDPEDLFGDGSDSDDEFRQDRDLTKEFVVYLVDASPKMFVPAAKSDAEKMESHFHVAMSCISQSLKTQIIGSSHDEVAICFFNTKEKKNLQDLGGVFVYNVKDRELLDRPTAKFIKEFDNLEETFAKEIGSCYAIVSGTMENSLYNVLWVAQSLLRKGSIKTVSKRILLFTNEDNPFRDVMGAIKNDMVRTTIQRAKDIQDLGISIDLLPLSCPNEKFDPSAFYSELLGVEGEEASQFLIYAGERQEDMMNQLRKKMFKKRKVKTLTFSIVEGVSIKVNTYALIRPTSPGKITWLDSITNLPLKAERYFVCSDTGALLNEPSKRFFSYQSKNVVFSAAELAKLKKISVGHLCLLGFKPLSCLKDYHNLRPATFVYPTDKEISGSIRLFIALHKSMLRLKRFAVAFLGSSSNPRIVALIAQDVVTTPGGLIEPPGMHMIYLPYSDDIRHSEESRVDVDSVTPRATEDQIKKASSLMRRIDLKDFSVCQFPNPALQRHYGILQAMALDEDEMPDIEDETLPDEEGMSRPGVVKALEDFKIAVYGENHDQEEADSAAAKASGSLASKKRKTMFETATRESSTYDWTELADSGRLKDLTVVELKFYLTAHNLPVTGKKEVLISRILTHLGK